MTIYEHWNMLFSFVKCQMIRESQFVRMLAGYGR